MGVTRVHAPLATQDLLVQVIPLDIADELVSGQCAFRIHLVWL